jgi:hypothetical protein
MYVSMYVCFAPLRFFASVKRKKEKVIFFALLTPPKVFSPVFFGKKVEPLHKKKLMVKKV